MPREVDFVTTISKVHPRYVRIYETLQSTIIEFVRSMAAVARLVKSFGVRALFSSDGKFRLGLVGEGILLTFLHLPNSCKPERLYNSKPSESAGQALGNAWKRLAFSLIGFSQPMYRTESNCCNQPKCRWFRNSRYIK